MHTTTGQHEYTHIRCHHTALPTYPPCTCTAHAPPNTYTRTHFQPKFESVSNKTPSVFSILNSFFSASPSKESFQDSSVGTPPSRETFLAALANIEAILVRATYHTVMMSSTIRDLSMDTAVPYYTGQEVTSIVEDCTCPPGYAGLSCQVAVFPSTFR